MDKYRNQIVWAEGLDRVEVDYDIAIKETSRMDAEIEKLQIEIDARRAIANRAVQTFNKALLTKYTDQQLTEAIEKHAADLERAAREAREVVTKHGPRTWKTR